MTSDQRIPPVAGVMGDPVIHSASPRIHGTWLQQTGIDGHYVRLPVRGVDLPAALAALPALGFRGVNLTLPHKEQALRLVDDIAGPAVAIGALNVVTVGPDGRLTGHNTDVEGVLAPLAPFDLEDRPVCVLGAGGAARAVLAALSGRRVGEVRLINRSVVRGQALLEHFGHVGWVGDWATVAQGYRGAALIINASSLGMVGQPPLPVEALQLAEAARDAVVFDIVYKPLETALLTAARAQGLATIDGLAMLLAQAAPAFKLFFGVAAPTDHTALRAMLTA